MVSHNKNTDRSFFQFKNSIQTYNYIFFFEISELRSFTYFILICEKKVKHISESHLIELFNWCANSTAELINIFTSIFFAFNIMRNQEQHIMHIDLAFILSHTYTHSHPLMMIIEQKMKKF